MWNLTEILQNSGFRQGKASQENGQDKQLARRGKHRTWSVADQFVKKKTVLKWQLKE